MTWWQALFLYAIAPMLFAGVCVAFYLDRKHGTPTAYTEPDPDTEISEEEWMNAIR